jgi:hypothetical protein
VHLPSLPCDQGEGRSAEGSIMGLLDALSDPKQMAEIQERNRIVGRLVEQYGLTRELARLFLFNFHAVDSSEGQTLH